MKKLATLLVAALMLLIPACVAAKPRIDHVVWVVMENKLPSVVIGRPSAPYITKLARTYGYASDYVSITHPSLPNYIAMTSGGLQGVAKDDLPFHQLPPLTKTYAVTAPSIFSELPNQSRSLMESMPFNCYKRDIGDYYARHNPMLYYVNEQSACSLYDVPLHASHPDLSARFTFIAPNLIDDQHNGTIQDGDHFLQWFIPKLQQTLQYRQRHTAIFIVWDESGPYLSPNLHVPLIAISPYTHHVVDRTHMSHYTLLRKAEQLLHVPLLENAHQAPNMSSFGF